MLERGSCPCFPIARRLGLSTLVNLLYLAHGSCSAHACLTASILSVYILLKSLYIR